MATDCGTNIPACFGRIFNVHRIIFKMRDQKKRLGIVMALAIFTLLAVTAFASATVTVSFPDPAVVSLNPTNPSQVVEFENQNLSDTPVVSVSLSSALLNVAQLSASSVSVPSHASVTVSIKASAPAGSYSGTLDYTGGSIPVSVFVQAPAQNTTPGGIIVFPTSKVISVQQGAEKTQNILISVPSTYPRTITINAVNFNPGTDPISFGDLNLGQVAPGNTIQIPIVFSGKEAQTGTYQTDLSILATDSEGQVMLPAVSLQLQVTAGVTPVTGETFSTKPTCSLSATDFNLNQTYSFTCSNAVSNLDIVPQYNEYFEGKKVEVSSGLYRYDFVPTKYGETTFKALFLFKGAPIFSAYSQDVRITSSGSLTPGTSLRFAFTPSLENALEGQAVLIQLVDNKTGSLVNSPIILVNAGEVNKTGSFSFEYHFEARKDYELRGKAQGYDDLVQTIKIDPKSITINVNPISGNELTFFNISTSVENATLLLNGASVSNPYYSTLPAGIVKIQAQKDGYNTAEINVTVDASNRIIAGGANFKKGEKQTLTLAEPGNYTVFYQTDLTAIERESYLTGTGTIIEFTPKKSGAYIVEVDGRSIATYQAEGFSFSNKWGFMPVWGWLLLVGGIIIIFVVIAYMKGGSSDADDGGGLNYAVGTGD